MGGTLQGNAHLLHQTSHHHPGSLTSKPTVPARQGHQVMKSGKAAGPDGIPPEALKVEIQTYTEMLHPLLSKIWERENVPEDWKKGHLVKLHKKGDLSSCGIWRGLCYYPSRAKF